VGAGHLVQLDAALGERPPAEIEQIVGVGGIADGGAEQGDPAGVGSRAIGADRGQVGVPHAEVAQLVGEGRAAPLVELDEPATHAAHDAVVALAREDAGIADALGVEVAEGALHAALPGQHGTERVDEGEARRPLAAPQELVRHLEGDHAAAGVAAEVVRPARLDGANRVEVERGHLLDAGERAQPAVDSPRLEPVERLCAAEVTGEVADVDDVAAGAVDAEERREVGRAGLDLDERRPGRLGVVEGGRVAIGPGKCGLGGRMRPPGRCASRCHGRCGRGCRRRPRRRLDP
jgi:hypothetical protein